MPPKMFLRFFRWFCHPKLKPYIEGDLVELYQARVSEKGKYKADICFVLDVLLLLRPGIIRPVRNNQPLNQYTMYKSYFKIGWRNLMNSKGYSAINIGGLAAGMAVAMLIGLWIYDEVSFNRYHQNYDRIAQVMVRGSNSSGWFVQDRTSPPFAAEIRALYGDSFRHVLMGYRSKHSLLSNEAQSINQSGYYFEPGAVEMLSLHMISGTAKSSGKKESVLLSSSAARALFGDADPINKSFKLDHRIDVVVSGVYEDLPANSDFSDLHFLATWDLLLSNNAWIRQDDWRQNGFFTWVQVSEDTDIHTASNRIKDVKRNRVNEDEARSKPELFLHPMSQWRLHSDFHDGVSNGGRIRFVWLYGTIGMVVLLLACINFMNLTTARSQKRAKEVGIRKSIGSARGQLISQFFSEALLTSFFAFLLSLCLVQLSLPFFNEVADKKMIIPWTRPMFWMMAIAFALLTGFLAGSYPALYLSSFNPIKVMKRAVHGGRFAGLPRKALVVVQFTVSITLIIGVIVVFRQIQFGKDRPVGYDREGLIWVSTYTSAVGDHLDAVRDELQKSGAIQDLAMSMNTITNVGFHFGGYDWTGEGPDPNSGFATAWVGHGFGKTVGWQFIDGRDFSAANASDSMGMILNESAVKHMQLKDPVGKTIRLTLFDKTESFHVIGVIHDVLMESPFEPVSKMVYMFDARKMNSGGSVINIRLNPALSAHEALALIEPVIKRYDPLSPFEFSFVSTAYNSKFSDEERTGKLASLFAGLAILISCLGIFGLASYVAEQRTKEIGIRKVMGASVRNLWSMLSKDFVVLVAIACVIAIPLSLYFMRQWLEQYEFKTTLSWYIFAFAGAGALLLTLVTVSFQAIKAASANPVRSLRSE